MCVHRGTEINTWVHLSADAEKNTGAVTIFRPWVTSTTHIELSGAPTGAGYVVTVDTGDDGTCAMLEQQADATIQKVDHRIAAGLSVMQQLQT